MLTSEAWNAFLKTLEEPPAHVLFILCTTEPHKVPDTVRSRVQRFDFGRVPGARIDAHLRTIAARRGRGAGAGGGAADRPSRPGQRPGRALPPRPVLRHRRPPGDPGHLPPSSRPGASGCGPRTARGAGGEGCRRRAPGRRRRLRCRRRSAPAAPGVLAAGARGRAGRGRLPRGGAARCRRGGPLPAAGVAGAGRLLAAGARGDGRRRAGAAPAGRCPAPGRGLPAPALPGGHGGRGGGAPRRSGGEARCGRAAARGGRTAPGSRARPSHGTVQRTGAGPRPGACATDHCKRSGGAPTGRSRARGPGSSRRRGRGSEPPAAFPVASTAGAPATAEVELAPSSGVPGRPLQRPRPPARRLPRRPPPGTPPGHFPVAAKAGGPAGELVSLEAWQRAWPALIEAVNRRDKVFAGVLRGCRPLDAGADRLVIGAPYDFHLKQLGNPAKRPILVSAVAAGRRWSPRARHRVLRRAGRRGAGREDVGANLTDAVVATFAGSRITSTRLVDHANDPVAEG